MMYKSLQMAREARILKAVATVVALFALALAGLTIALAPSEARPEALLVCVGTFCIAVFMWVYSSWPDVFSGDAKGVLGDELRATYTVPAPTPAPAVEAAPPVIPAQRGYAVSARPGAAVSEHIYVWQGVRRVEPGQRVWTAAYGRLVALQVVATILGVLAFAALVVGVTLGLGRSVGPVWFVAAGVILWVGFAMSHRSGVVDSTSYATAPMKPMPDVIWHPGSTTPHDVSAQPAVDTHAA